MLKSNQVNSNEIRQSYSASLLPSRFVTWMTGKALPEQKPLLNLNWIHYTLAMLTIFLLSVILGFYNQFNQANLYVTLACWAGLVFSSRRMAAVILHQSVHARLSTHQWFDRLIGDLVTVLMFTQDFKTYQHDHCQIHHAPKTFATRLDPIVNFFTTFGIKPGARKHQLYWAFFSTLLSPLFHLTFLISRLAYNVNASRPLRSVLSILYISILVNISFQFSGGLFAFFMAFFLPLVLFYQISAFIEICSEHAWFDTHVKSQNELETNIYFYADISWGRFCGSRYPKGQPVRILNWYLSQFFIHLPVRLFILVGDLPQHDYHHRHPLCFDWVNARFNRQAATQNLLANEPEYIDIWGLHNAIEHVFNVLASKSEEEIESPLYSGH